MGSLLKFYLTSDVADAMNLAGLPTRAQGSVRQAVRQGRLTPSGFSPRGVAVWTEQDLRECLELQARVASLRLRTSDVIRRLSGATEPLQLEIPEEKPA